MDRVDVAVLGATGAVGQRFIQLLADHPWFRVAEVVASDRSAGKPYAEACRWVLNGQPPADVADPVRRPAVHGLWHPEHRQDALAGVRISLLRHGRGGRDRGQHLCGA